jgi:hypothetical protein
MVLPYVVRGEVTTEHSNQSLPGVLFRLTTVSASFIKYEGLRQIPDEYHNLVALPPTLVSWMLRCCLLAFAGLAVWACRLPRRDRQPCLSRALSGTGKAACPYDRGGWCLSAEFSLVLLGMLLFSERSWKHHHVTLILPAAVLLYYLSTRRPGRALRNYLIGTLLLAALLMTATGTGLDERAGKLAQVYGGYLWANLLLAGSLIVLLRCQKANGQDTEETPGTTDPAPVLSA